MSLELPIFDTARKNIEVLKGGINKKMVSKGINCKWYKIIPDTAPTILLHTVETQDDITRTVWIWDGNVWEDIVM